MNSARSDVLLFENPPECAFVVGEHLSDALVVHVLVVELLFQELVLLADFFFVAHIPARDFPRKNLHTRNGSPPLGPVTSLAVGIRLGFRRCVLDPLHPEGCSIQKRISMTVAESSKDDGDAEGKPSAVSLTAPVGRRSQYEALTAFAPRFRGR